jgi:hypothetical protein
MLINKLPSHLNHLFVGERNKLKIFSCGCYEQFIQKLVEVLLLGICGFESFF